MSFQNFDCTTCGACCFGGHDHYVVLLPEDRGRVIPDEAVREIEGRRYMRMQGGHCAQLCRSPDARLVCGIYEVRPEACRAFRAGSFECLKARQYRGHLADAMRHPVSAPPLRAETERPEADLPPAHIVANRPKGRMKPPA
ncbi:MAG: YkgJ family cysteine cluster protein [Rhodobacteraceae bacterium]|nr:YkgJ family cysteine cluster protein [Paracoccaceae bacterium]